jgi:hypothetical protein
VENLTPTDFKTSDRMTVLIAAMKGAWIDHDETGNIVRTVDEFQTL